MSIEQNDARRLDLIADALDDAFLAASDEEILEDAKAAGLNTAAEATRVKGMLLAAVQRVQKRNLVAAKAGYQEAVDALRSRAFRLPETPAERRQLFELVVARQPQYVEMYTTQHRELQDLTDSDIESYLEDLAALGVLDELAGHGG